MGVNEYDRMLREYYGEDAMRELVTPKVTLLDLYPRTPPTRWQRFRWWLRWPLRRFRAWLHRDCGCP